jgi:hypothetical protein
MIRQHTGWCKSRHSDPNGTCIEVGQSKEGMIGVRDSKQQGAGPILEFTRSEWAAFLSAIQNS